MEGKRVSGRQSDTSGEIEKDELPDNATKARDSGQKTAGKRPGDSLQSAAVDMALGYFITFSPQFSQSLAY